MSLFSKLFGKKKKKHHQAAKPEPIACDDLNPEDCGCVGDDGEHGLCDDCDVICEDDD
ncbi:hypothetical protein [Anaerosporomusa subterranea]|uniref:hypothetical protein n=1 Tax=Anaerosporomusa subterranea TaxID=1794912 RepID=UPI0012E872E1|nr:hypothetical protein [Anaerosporomusa subterranea]